MRRRLLDDVSKGELLQMRADGMTNEEIAESLDVNYMTVYRIIGAQPNELSHRGRKKGGRSVVEAPPKKQEEEIIPACLVTVNRTIELQGATAKYALNIDKKSVMVKLENAQGNVFDTLLLNVESLGTFINELQAIQRKIVTFDTVEAW